MINNISGNTIIKHFLLIIVLTAGLYMPSLHGEFVYDDHETIVKNPYVKDLKYVPAYFDPRNVKMWSFHEGQRHFYRPIPLASFALNYHISGLNPFSYHVVNVLLHILTALSVYLAVHSTARVLDRQAHGERRYTRLALIASLLFAIHPLQTESVAYIVSRSVMICTFFMLWSFITFMQAYENDGKLKNLSRIVSVAFFALSLCSKEIAVVFPLLIFAYSFLYNKSAEAAGHRLKVVSAVLPYFAVLAGYFVLRIVFFGQAAISSLISTYFIHYFATAVKTVFIYLRLLIIPIGQNVDHFLPIVQNVFEPSSVLALAALIMVVWILFAKVHSYSPFLFFWILWYFLSLCPNLLLPTKEAISEHTVYFPSIGFFVLCAYIAVSVWAHYGRIFAGAQRLVGIGLVLIIVTQLLLLTLNRNIVWQNEMALWEDAVAMSPAKDRTHVNLGLAYFNAGCFEEAVSEYMTALSINPNNAVAMNNLGLIFAKMGKSQEAKKAFNKSIEVERLNPDAYNNLGFLLFTEGRYEASISVFNEALRFSPDCSLILSNLGAAYIKAGEKEKGCGCLRKGVDINPDDKRGRALYNVLCKK